MCGIAGIIQIGGLSTPDPLLVLNKMSASISYRGPDDEGSYIDGHSVLAHRRLSIIDVGGGRQPWLSSERDVVLVFNGEIFNHRDLRLELEDLGYKYRSHCDTETLLFAYQEWEEACVEKLRGMFAFVIWDNRRKKVFAARDRLGLKPLYYHAKDDLLVFGSELKAVAQYPFLVKEIDTSAFVNYLRLGYFPAPSTPLKEVFKLPAATSLVLDANGLRTNKYWNIDDFATVENCSESYSDASRNIKDLVDEAVRYRLESEVPLGAFLSGGVDSSIVALIASRQLNKEIKTQFVRFNHEEFDETEYAQEVASLVGSEHQVTDVGTEIREDLKKIVFHMDEPFADDSAIPTFYLCREAKKRMSVALSGDGGDEVFAGYDWYKQLLANQKLGRFVPRSMTAIIQTILKNHSWSTIRGFAFLNNIGTDPAQQHSNLRSLFSDKRIANLIGDRSLDSAGEHPILKEYKKLAPRQDVISRAQIVDLNLYLADGILQKVDKMSMAHGLEVRVPLLDHKLVEYCVSLPSVYMNDGKSSKRILKDVAKDSLPASLIHRKKRGFSPPLGRWLEHELYEFVEKYLLTPGGGSGVLSSEEVKKVWDEFLAQRKSPALFVDSSRRVWALLCFEIWYELFMEN